MGDCRGTNSPGGGLYEYNDPETAASLTCLRKDKETRMSTVSGVNKGVSSK